VGLTFSILGGMGALFAPAAVAGVATAAVIGAGFATMALFGQGMLRQGEDVTKLMATSRMSRKSMLAEALDEVKSRFKPRAASPNFDTAAAPAFDKAANPAVTVETAAPEQAAAPTPAAPKP